MPSTTPFERAMKWLMRKDVEAGWYDGKDPRDPNPTLDGVTQKTYDKFRRGAGQTKRTVRLMEPAERESIYRVLYWTKGKCEQMAQKSETMAIIHFDACVNHGVTGAIELLQRTLGIDDDGVFGPITGQNYVSEMLEDGEVKMATRYLKARIAQYKHIAQLHPDTLALNLKGWLARIEKLRDYLALP